MSSVANQASIADASTRLGCAPDDIPLLGSLPVAVRQRLLAASRVEKFAPRAQLFGGADMPEHLHVVLSGLIDLSCSYKGGECSALMMAAGDVFMPAAALYSEPYLVSAYALAPSRILLIDAKVVRDEARKCPELALALTRVM